MKYFSMFSGIGGFELGIHQAYFDQSTDPHTPLDYQCVGYSEIDKYAIQIYEQHFNHKNYGDATKINASELPDFDLLVGGFPCQAFSIAGKRGGLDDTRGTLFYDIARIAKEKRPQHLLLENVKGLLSHNNGRTFKLIISTFAELGYNLEWQVLNSKNFGVPQNRERVFIIGHLGACCGRQVFPLGESGELSAQERLDTPPSISALTSTDYKGASKQRPNLVVPTMQEITKNVSDAQRVYKSSGIAKTLKGLGGGLGAKTGMYEVEPMRIRRLTPTECERLQAYPDGWTEGVSDTQRYKTLGNSVTVSVIEEIIKRLYV